MAVTVSDNQSPIQAKKYVCILSVIKENTNVQKFSSTPAIMTKNP